MATEELIAKHIEAEVIPHEHRAVVRVTADDGREFVFKLTIAELEGMAGLAMRQVEYFAEHMRRDAPINRD